MRNKFLSIYVLTHCKPTYSRRRRLSVENVNEYFWINLAQQCPLALTRLWQSVQPLSSVQTQQADAALAVRSLLDYHCALKRGEHLGCSTKLLGLHETLPRHRGRSALLNRLISKNPLLITISNGLSKTIDKRGFHQPKSWQSRPFLDSINFSNERIGFRVKDRGAVTESSRKWRGE